MSSDPRDNERTDYDARFAEIIAQFDDNPLDASALEESPTQHAPTSNDDDDSPPVEPTSPEPESTPPRADPIAALPTQWRMPSSDEPPAVLEDDGTYEPPPPQPLPAGDLQFWGILAGLVGGPLWLLYLFFFDRDARSMWWVLACLASATGLVMLVMRQPHSREDQDDHDDGAVL